MGKLKHSEGSVKYSRTKEYYTWINIKQRCHNPKNKSYQDYGAKGIKVCDRWSNSYEAFLSDMGRCPPDKISIERINNNRDYEPGNCRWATSKEQNSNKHNSRIIEHNGVKKTLAEWARHLNTYHKKISRFLDKGNTFEQFINIHYVNAAKQELVCRV